MEIGTLFLTSMSGRVLGLGPVNGSNKIFSHINFCHNFKNIHEENGFSDKRYRYKRTGHTSYLSCLTLFYDLFLRLFLKSIISTY